jgi:hypothetical protein
MKKLFILFFCTILAFFSASAQQRGGTLHQFPDVSFMLGVSQSGQYATGYVQYGLAGAIRWTQGSGVDHLNGGDASEAYAVSNNGVVA